jgi:hypothetical protein
MPPNPGTRSRPWRMRWSRRGRSSWRCGANSSTPATRMISTTRSSPTYRGSCSRPTSRLLGSGARLLRRLRLAPAQARLSRHHRDARLEFCSDAGPQLIIASSEGMAILSGGHELANRYAAGQTAATPQPQSAHLGCRSYDAFQSCHRINPTPSRYWRRSYRSRRIDDAAR